MGGPARARASPRSRTRCSGISLGAHGVRRPRRIRSSTRVLRAHEPLDRGRAASASSLTPSGRCVRRVAASTSTSSPSVDPDGAGHARPQPVEPGVLRPRRVLRVRASRSPRRRATGASSSAATARWRSPRRSGARSSPDASGAGLDPCGALQVTLEIPAGRPQEADFVLGEGTRSRARRDADRAARAARRGAASVARARSTTRVEHDPRRDRGPDPGRFVRPHHEPVARSTSR